MCRPYKSGLNISKFLTHGSSEYKYFRFIAFFLRYILITFFLGSCSNFPTDSSNDAEDGTSPESPVTDIDLTENNDSNDSDDSTSHDAPNRTKQSSRQSSQSRLSLIDGSSSEIPLDNGQAEEGTTSSRTNVYTPEPSIPFLVFMFP